MRKKFVTWYAEEIKKQMDAGVPSESIDVNLKLTSVKALHANWLSCTMFIQLLMEERRS